ncbi:MAG: right-handed parallel beta-helix repeat-containing protein [Saprospiraceae bacterium]|nr:right-handed parallel beta-helix repeat-containing protein [Saprospiraceae bacterium]
MEPDCHFRVQQRVQRIARVTGDCGAPDEVSFALTEAGPVHNVTTNRYYCTIQSAINAASNNHTIAVAAGTYTENITINGKNGLVINGPYAGLNNAYGTRVAEAIITSASATTSLITVASGVTSYTIDGFKLVGADYTSPGTAPNQGNIIWASGATQSNILNNLIEISSNTSGTKRYIWLGGSSATLSGSPHISGNISYNSFTAAGTGSGFAGITTQLWSQNLNITGNKFTGMKGQRNLLMNGPTATVVISNNEFFTSDDAGARELIRFEAGSPTEMSGGATIQNNSFSITGTGKAFSTAAAVNYGANISVTNNDFTNVSGAAINHGGSGTIVATCNWWGQQCGPLAGDIVGSATSTPWITADTDGNAATGFQPSGSCNGGTAVVATGTQVNITSCFGDSNGSINLSVSGGLAPYTYLWSNGATTEDISSLAAGTYSVTVTDFCGLMTNQGTASFTITQPTQNTGSGAVTSNYNGSQLSCNGASDGAITVTASGGTGTYQYSLNGGTYQISNVFSGLTAGTYTIDVKDANDCEVGFANVTITAPTVPTANISNSVNVICNGGSMGSATVTAAGGTPGYTYLWSNGATVATASGLVAGTYTVTVNDANLCAATATVTITQPDPLTGTSTQVNVLCNGASSGSIDLSVSGGTAPYTYLWSNGATTQDIISLAAGPYSVTVNDNILAADNTPYFDAFSTTHLPGGAQPGTLAGTVDLQNGWTTRDAFTTATTVGKWDQQVIQVNDVNGNRKVFRMSNAITSNTYTSQVFSATSGQVAGETNAALWNNRGTIGSSPFNPAQFGAYAANNTFYTKLKFRSVTGAAQSGLSLGLSPSAKQSSVRMSLLRIVDNGSTGFDLIFTEAGANGATFPGTTIATGLPYTVLHTLEMAITFVDGVSTGGGDIFGNDIVKVWLNGSLIHTGTTWETYYYNFERITPAVPRLQAVDALLFRVANPAVPATSGNGFYFEDFRISNTVPAVTLYGLAALSGCTTSTSTTITQPAAPVAVSTTQTNVTCNGTATGTINLTVSGGTPPYTYSWSNGATTEDISGLIANNYGVTVTDANGSTSGCTAILDPALVITQPDVLMATSTNDSPIYAGSTLNLSSNVLGGTMTYSYSWTGPDGFVSNDANPSITNATVNANGTYYLTVTDANGCQANTSTSAIIYGTTLYVNDNSATGDVYTTALGDDNNPGTPSAPFATVAKAIMVANNGNTIYVDAGTYNENLSIAGKNGLVIKGPNTGLNNANGTRVAEAIITSASATTSLITVASGVTSYTIDGFKLVGADYTSPGTAPNQGNIIWASGATQSNILNNLIEISSNTTGTKRYIWLGGSSATLSGNPHISGNISYNSFTAFGTGSGFAGITTQLWSQNLNITGNKFTGMKGQRNLLMNGPTATVVISNNEFFTSDDAGARELIRFENGSPSVMSGGATIQNNSFSITGTGKAFSTAAAVDYGANISVTNNDFTNVSGAAINHGGSGTIVATCNWYGTEDAFDIAASITGSANFLPFLRLDNDYGNVVSWSTDKFSCIGVGPVVVYDQDPILPATNIISSHMTIQAAIDAPTTISGAGHYIAVSSGNYDELVTVNKEVTISGFGADNTLLEKLSPAIEANFITIAASNVTIKDIAIVGPSGVSTSRGIYMNSTLSDITIKNVISNQHNRGIFVDAASTITGLTIENTQLNVNGNGLEIAASAKIDGLTITGGQMNGNSFGLSASANNSLDNSEDLKNVTITNTTFDNNGVFGLLFNKGKDMTLTGLTVTNNGNASAFGVGAGIYFTWRQGSYSNVTVTNSTITGNRTSGADLGGGIWVRPRVGASATGVSITNNRIANNASAAQPATAGILVLRNDNNTGTDPGISINSNSITGNANFGIASTTTADINATCNWWGTPIGNNIPAMVSGNVDYDAWLVPDMAGATYPWSGVDKYSCTGSPVVISSVSSTPNQYCQNNGQITVYFTGGVTPYTASWTGTTSGGPVACTSGIAFGAFTNGTYTLTVSDINGSTASTMVSVSNLPVRRTSVGPVYTYYSTIQDAINALVAGEVIDICAGTYTETININKALTINGPNVGTSGTALIRAPEAVLLNCSIDINNAGNTTLDGLHIKRTDVTAGTQLALDGGGINTVQNCIFERTGPTPPSNAAVDIWAMATTTAGGNKIVLNNKITGDATGGLFGNHKSWARGIYVDQGAFTVNISGNTFENCRTAMNVDDYNNNVTISGNTINNNGTHISLGGATPTAGSYVLGSNNFINNVASTMINCVNVAESFRLNITSSTLNGVSFGALTHAQLFDVEARMYHKEAYAGRKGKVTYVAGKQFLNNFSLVGPPPFTKIDQINNGIKYADAPEIINLQAGTYNQKVVIDKSNLTLRGITNDKTLYIISGSGITTGAAPGSGIVLNSGITGITIKNLTVQNFTGADGNSHAGIYGIQNNSNLVVDTVALLNNTNASGFYANGLGSGINNVTVTNSMVTNNGGGARGIVIWNGLKTNINISNNTLSNNRCCGIELSDGNASAVTVVGNTIDVGAGDNAIGLIGLNATVGANLIQGNTITGGGRFGIEIKNPAGGVTVNNNSVTLTTQDIDLRDRAGIAVFRRGVLNGNVDVPNGVTVTNNTVTGYKQTNGTSSSTGFGIVVEGTNHVVNTNMLINNGIAIQLQAGHTPYVANQGSNDALHNGNQTNLADNYFGRGNSPELCNVTTTGNTFSLNTLNGIRVVTGGGLGTIQTDISPITPTVNAVADQLLLCPGTNTAAVTFTGNNLTGVAYNWSNDNTSIGLAASGTGNITSFVVTNTTDVTQIATITVTPVVNGCEGTPENFVISVKPDWDITATAGAGGSISPAGVTTLCSGAGQIYTITPDMGYGILDVLVDGVSNPAAILSGTYEFTNATSHRTIHATFNLLTTISGKIIWEHDDATGVKDATVSVTGAGAGSDDTDVDGNYSVTLVADGNFTITPTKNINRLNGVTAVDAMAVQQHITNAAPITDPYKLIAADVNRSNTVTTADASIINQSILGNPATDAIFNKFWRFVPSTPVLTLPPWGFAESIALTGVSGNQPNNDFIGIKLGDVNGTSNAALRGIPNVALITNDRVLKVGEDIDVVFKVKNFNEIGAYQLAMSFDTDQLQFEQVIASEFIPFSAGNFGTFNISGGELRAVWSRATGFTIPDGSEVFVLRFRSLKDGINLSDVLHIDELNIPAQAYKYTYEAAGIDLVYDVVSAVTEVENKEGLRLLQNRPNPFHEQTTIGFELPVAGEATIKVYNSEGQFITERKGKYPSGYHEEVFSFANGSGILFYELVTDKGILMRKMIQIRR